MITNIMRIERKPVSPNFTDEMVESSLRTKTSNLSLNSLNSKNPLKRSWSKTEKYSKIKNEISEDLTERVSPLSTIY